MSQPDECSTTQIERYLQLFAREAGRQALELQGHLDHISSKDGQELHGSNIVTEADGQIGHFAEEFFPRMFPDCLVIQEETADQVDVAHVSPDTLIFIVDPVDGTVFYARRSFAWTISVGCFQGWKPLAGCIYAPQLQSLYYTQGSSSFLNDARIEAHCPGGSLRTSVMVRHIRAMHNIDAFPGYSLSYGSPALHLALVASGFACACVTSTHYIYDVAGAAKLLENAGAELRYLGGARPAWRELILNPTQKSPEPFFACPQGAFERLVGYVKPSLNA